jgi:tetratricopeptide (TPR) repeat protein
VELAKSNMANAAKAEGNFDLARNLLEQVAAASQARGDVRGVASALNGLGDLAASEGDHDAARRYHHQSLVRYRQINDRWGTARVLADLAHIDLKALDYTAAARLLKEALQAFHALGHQRGVARQLESLAWCAGCQSRSDEAVTLASAAAAIRLKIGTPAKQAEQERIDSTLTAARTRIGNEAFENAWKEGRTAPLDRILGIAIAPSA